MIRWILFLAVSVPGMLGTMLALVSATLHFAAFPPGPSRWIGYLCVLALGIPATIGILRLILGLSMSLFQPNQLQSR